MKTLVGIFRTEGVEEPSMEWYNGGIIWKGKLLLDITVTIYIEGSVKILRTFEPVYEKELCHVVQNIRKYTNVRTNILVDYNGECYTQRKMLSR